MYLIGIFQFILMIRVMLGANQKVTYVSLERATIAYVNPKYGKGHFTTRRYNRRDPVYYFNANFTSYVWVANNYTMHFFFYELLSNTYKRSFVELHYGICDLVHNNKYIGDIFKQGRLAGPCPYPPGDYNLSNVTVPNNVIPRGFPFTKGRIYANITLGPATDDEVLFCGHMDMELKQRNN